MPGLLLFAHGSRDPEWSKPFETLLHTTQKTYPDATVVLAYLEKMQPNFFTAAETLIMAGCTTITILPLFLARGGHLKADLKTLFDEAKTRWPNTQWAIAPCIGDSDFMQAAMVKWIGNHL